MIKGDLWFDLETGELIDEHWKRLLAWDPLRMVDRHVSDLRSLRFIQLESGSEDEYGLHLGHRQIAKKLQRHGIPFHIDEYPGKHSGHHHRMPLRIARMVKHLVES